MGCKEDYQDMLAAPPRLPFRDKRQIGDSILYLGDFRQVFPLLGAVDAVVTDPPYGISLANHGRNKNEYAIRGDEDDTLAMTIYGWCLERKVPLAMFYSPYRPPQADWRSILVWDKGPAVGAGGDPKTCWKRTFELVGVNFNKPLKGARDEAVLRHWMSPNYRNDHRFHPMVKPVGLMAYLVCQLTGTGEIVLDPCMGSGTTGVACVQKARRFIGIETDDSHYVTACRRIEAAHRAEATELFAPVTEPTLFSEAS